MGAQKGGLGLHRMFRDALSPIVEGLLMIVGPTWQHHRMCVR